jgi:hypothetical protein
MGFRAMRALSVRLLLIAALVAGAPFACTSKEGSSIQGRTQEDCIDACWRLSSANCGDVGEECVDRCIRERVTPGTQCAHARETYANCFWKTPEYICDARFGSFPTDCDAEFAALHSCLGLGLADAASDAAAFDAAPSDAAPDAADARATPARDAADD